MNSRLCFACICLVIGILGVDAKEEASQVLQLGNISVVQDLQQFAKTHPGLQLLPMTKVVGKGRHGSVVVNYKIGEHILADRLAAILNDQFDYPAKKDVAVQLTYPVEGTGVIVTYVELNCAQDNNDGNAYVVAGGIGQRFISIMVEAKQTETFYYNVQVWGTD